MLSRWGHDHAWSLLFASVALPLSVALMAALLQRWADRRSAESVANGLILSSVGVLVITLVLALLADWLFAASLAQAHIGLLLAPIAYLVTSFGVIHGLFPLNRLGSVRALKDVGWFLLASLVVVWLLSKFRGWGVVFFGGLLQLLLIGGAIYWLLRRLWLRARGRL